MPDGGAESTDLGRLTDACVHCGFCLPACPTYQLTGEEPHSPRGRIHLLRQLLDGQAGPEQIAGPLDTCLGCLACVPACPSGVDYEHIIEAGRELVADARPVRERATLAAVHAVLPRPDLLRLGTLPLKALARIDPLFAAAADLAPGRRPRARAVPPRVAARPNGDPDGPARATVGLLTGCAQSVWFRHVTAATARVLALEGCDVIVPPDQGCCGALALHGGRRGQARRLARRLVGSFVRAGVDTIVTDVAGCGSAIKGYARLLADDPTWAGPAARLAAGARDVSEFLAELGPVATRYPVEATVAYHDACHLAYGQRITAAPRALLAGVPDLRVVELGDGGRCCGSAGTYNLTQPEIASELGDQKVAAIMATGASVVAAGNPGCLLQIEAGLRRAGAHVAARHTIELLDASLRPNVRP